ncbi:hypothetical protein [Breoghania sp.]|uniref:hypothetical protein n=1 Tax=Breoghania sp. TaxID=2065378 RepID=UPI002611063F|nr:hypothetical protein [Breoghania sp.]MDJ0932554.1 hypothetical protein [Breoghania sp.]
METTEAELLDDPIRRERPEDLSDIFLLEQANLTAFPSLMLHFDGAWLTWLSLGNPVRRVNSLNIYDPADDRDVEARLERAVVRFADADIPMHLRWTPLVPQALDDLIDARGWQRYAQTEVWSVAIAGDGTVPDTSAENEIVRLPRGEWLRDFAAVGGTGADKVTPGALATLRASLEKVPAELLALSLRGEDGDPQVMLLAVCDGGACRDLRRGDRA